MNKLGINFSIILGLILFSSLCYLNAAQLIMKEHVAAGKIQASCRRFLDCKRLERHGQAWNQLQYHSRTSFIFILMLLELRS
jgi:hypothetical protein